jgi:hypothetical protein
VGPTPEEEEFERAFAAMMTESLEGARAHAPALRSGATEHLLSLPSLGGGHPAPPAARPGLAVLTLLKRKATGKASGFRVEARPLLVPAALPLAQVARRADATRAAEAEELKQRTLALHEASVMEESERAGARGRGGWGGRGRGRG